MKYIDAAMQKVKTKVNDGSTDLSILEKILIDNDDPRYAVAMAFDILFAGVDTVRLFKNFFMGSTSVDSFRCLETVKW